MFGYTAVVINSLDVAREILGKRSAIYSDRPRWVMGGELCGLNRTTVLFPYGSKLKEHRALFSRGVSAKGSLEKYHSVMEYMAQSLASGLASDSNDLIGQIHRYASISVSYPESERIPPLQVCGKPSARYDLRLYCPRPGGSSDERHREGITFPHHDTWIGCIPCGCIPVS